MSIAHEISYVERFGSSGGTTASIDTTGCDLLVVAVSDYSASDTLTDSEGNTWTVLQETSAIAGGRMRLRYCLNPTTSETHTFTTTGSYSTVGIGGFSGVDAYDTDTANSSSASATKQPGSITPPGDGCLLVTACAFQSTATATIDSGFAVGDQVPYQAGQGLGFAIGYYVQDTAAAVNPTWTVTNSIHATMASFTPSAGGGGVSATISQTLPALTQAATGTTKHEAAVVQSLPALTQSAAATTKHQAAVAQSLPALTQSAAATTKHGAAVAQTLPALTQAATAGNGTISAAVAQTLPALTQSATGTTKHEAAVAQSLPALTQAATATVGEEGVTAAIAQTLPALTQAAIATTKQQAVIAQLLPSLTQAVQVGEVVITGVNVLTIARPITVHSVSRPITVHSVPVE